MASHNQFDSSSFEPSSFERCTMIKGAQGKAVSLLPKEIAIIGCGIIGLTTDSTALQRIILEPNRPTPATAEAK